MPREQDRVQAQAQLGERYRAQGSSGVSPWLVVGIVVLAASLVAVGATVILSSLRGDPSSTASKPDSGQTPPGQPRPTSQVFTVGRQDGGSDANPTPTTGTGPGLAPPASSGAGRPLFVPQPPVDQAPTASPGGGQGQASPAPSPADGGQPQATTGPATGGSPSTAASPSAPATTYDQAVESAMSRLTTDEDKVGQLLLLAWIGNTAEQARPELADLRAGGIVFVQNTASSAEAKSINQGLQRIAADANLLPPLTAIDHEGGIVQRIKDVPNLGNNWVFGRLRPSNADACDRGLKHAQVLKDMGFTMNLAPVLDVNNNPANPVIGERSYSDDPQLVARLGAAYIRGLQGGGVAAVGKHFPGHGNTSVDSHVGLPSLPQSVDELEKIELVPFRRAVAPETGVAGIMSAHIVFPAVDPSGLPATLSRAVMTGLLRDRLGFQGLALSDDMGGMKAITDNFAPGEAAVRAVQAGVDMITLSTDVAGQRVSRNALLAAVRSGSISRDRLDQAVRNVLQVKARYGLLGVPAQVGGGCS